MYTLGHDFQPQVSMPEAYAITEPGLSSVNYSGQTDGGRCHSATGDLRGRILFCQDRRIIPAPESTHAASTSDSGGENCQSRRKSQNYPVQSIRTWYDWSLRLRQYLGGNLQNWLSDQEIAQSLDKLEKIMAKHSYLIFCYICKKIR